MDDAELRRDIGRRMREARRGRGSQRLIAERVGCDQSRLSRWESGKAMPGLVDLLRFCAACETRPEVLLRGLVMPSAEQMRLELDADAEAAVYRIVQVLHERTSGARAARDSARESA